MILDIRPLGFWSTVRLLLRVARKRADARRERQQELLQYRAKKNATDWGSLGFVFTVFLMLVVNVLAAFVLKTTFEAGQRVEVERQGKMVVSRSFFNKVRAAETAAQDTSDDGEERFRQLSYFSEADRIADRDDTSEKVVEEQLRKAVKTYGSAGLIPRDEASSGLANVAHSEGFAAMLGSIVLLWWGTMLVFQGEGLELDIQRRRHPMWEFLFSHPVPPGAIFFAEMLAPLAANPVYWGAPLFVGTVYAFVYDPGVAVLAALLIGVPVAVATACSGKALEIGVTLRFAPRTRGAIIGLMSWAGYASMMLCILGFAIVPKVIGVLQHMLSLFRALTAIPWPWLRIFLGGLPDGSFSFALGILSCWSVALVTIAGSVWFSVWATEKGLSGIGGDSQPARRKSAARFGQEPLYRKELLWFARDRSAIIQTILIPITVAGVQAFNFRGILSHATGTWNYICGIAILFGTYFLWILGPKSLSSEGSALWVALTWPRGLETLLKAKAWLWSLISTGMVALILAYCIYLFPSDAGKIIVVGVGWFLFSRSMAEKTVTLVTVTSESGEPKKIPSGRRWAAQLGMLTFAIGVVTEQWNLAIVGIVYSFITAAAMWQNFRARLPYLYDEWSETLPPAPTLMHAMVSISILVEATAVLTGFVVVIVGSDGIAIAQAISYGLCAIVVSGGLWSFLEERGVTLRDVYMWPEQHQLNRWWEGSRFRELALVLLGAVAGLELGLFARLYSRFLFYFPTIAELLVKSQQAMARIPNLRISYIVMAVGFAPFAEEYLFRGVLFRALDREWGGWNAVLGSAVFFAIYHPTLSWLPVGLLGVCNALIFKKTGRLAPAVLLHMVYNAVVLM